MTVMLNHEALRYAEQLIDDGAYKLNTIWRGNQPDSAAAEAFAAKQGEDALSKWYLGIDADQQGIERYRYVYGDFRNLHHTGLRALCDEAQRAGDKAIVEAAESLLFLLDRANAC